MAVGETTAANVRRIAILVTSLDAVAARQLLLHMPTELAKQVRRAMASLGRIDPFEQQKILTDFRRAAGSAQVSQARLPESAPSDESPTYSTFLTKSPQFGSNPNGLDAIDTGRSPEPQNRPSAVSEHRLAANDPNLRPSSITGNPSEPNAEVTWKRLHNESLAHLLRGERAAVVAVVVSQLKPQAAVELMKLIPADQHPEILARLGRLEEIDEDAMTAIDDHLAGKLKDYHHQLTTTSESLSRVEGILLAASPEMRQKWLAELADSDLDLAGRLSLASPLSTPASPLTLASEPDTARVISMESVSKNRSLTENPTEPTFPGSSQLVTENDQGNSSLSTDERVEVSSSNSVDRSLLAIEFDGLLELPLPLLAMVLNAAESETVLLAIAGASPGFSARFLGMLDRQDARDLQRRLRNIGPMNLRDIDAAQRQIVEIAYRLQERSGSSKGRVAIPIQPTLARAA